MDAERIARKADSILACEFGIPFLRDALNGILPSDLIVIAGRTGFGKTELATLIAAHNCMNGKKVFLIALEAGQYEIERRIKYRLLSQRFFERREQFGSIKLSYTDWLFDRMPKDLDGLEDEVEQTYPLFTENLEIYTPPVMSFSKKAFAEVYAEAADQADLIILDHIHYLSADDRENEYDHIKKTMWALRDSINKYRTPIIAFSHLRKESYQDKAFVPGLEEIHGSSEITKQSNHVVVFGHAYKLPLKDNPTETYEPPAGSTLVRVLKSRTGHMACERYVGLMRFDFLQKKYEDDYVPYRIDRQCTQLSPVKYQDFEFWMGLGREPRN